MNCVLPYCFHNDFTCNSTIFKSIISVFLPLKFVFIDIKQGLLPYYQFCPESTLALLQGNQTPEMVKFTVQTIVWVTQFHRSSCWHKTIPWLEYHWNPHYIVALFTGSIFHTIAWCVCAPWHLEEDLELTPAIVISCTRRMIYVNFQKSQKQMYDVEKSKQKMKLLSPSCNIM